MASRKIGDLHPTLQPLAKKMIELCKEVGIDYLIYCTYRSSHEQDGLYSIGRTTPGKIVTNAKGGQSKHNYMLNNAPASKAFDGAPLINGKIIWDSKHPLWQKIGEIGHSLGLVWGMDWKGKFKEMPHWELKEVVK